MRNGDLLFNLLFFLQWARVCGFRPSSPQTVWKYSVYRFQTSLHYSDHVWDHIISHLLATVRLSDIVLSETAYSGAMSFLQFQLYCSPIQCYIVCYNQLLLYLFSSYMGLQLWIVYSYMGILRNKPTNSKSSSSQECPSRMRVWVRLCNGNVPYSYW